MCLPCAPVAKLILDAARKLEVLPAVGTVLLSRGSLPLTLMRLLVKLIDVHLIKQLRCFGSKWPWPIWVQLSWHCILVQIHVLHLPRPVHQLVVVLAVEFSDLVVIRPKAPFADLLRIGEHHQVGCLVELHHMHLVLCQAFALLGEVLLSHLLPRHLRLLFLHLRLLLLLLFQHLLLSVFGQPLLEALISLDSLGVLLLLS